MARRGCPGVLACLYRTGMAAVVRGARLEKATGLRETSPAWHPGQLSNIVTTTLQLLGDVASPDDGQVWPLAPELLATTGATSKHAPQPCMVRLAIAGAEGGKAAVARKGQVLPLPVQCAWGSGM